MPDNLHTGQRAADQTGRRRRIEFAVEVLPYAGTGPARRYLVRRDGTAIRARHAGPTPITADAVRAVHQETGHLADRTDLVRVGIDHLDDGRTQIYRYGLDLDEEHVDVAARDVHWVSEAGLLAAAHPRTRSLLARLTRHLDGE
ncbi:hypothetical protein [Nonomuraea salmonea]|uniref:NUDIX hydrolase n=1 Tax=Nonomuraea salmonea TaxID=46181 RepID=A0ABV5P2U6_9ACTN